MSEPNLQELLGERKPRNVFRPELTTEQREARKSEAQRRSNTAQGMAITALRRLHPEDYGALLRQARQIVDAESGPLPGDEVAS